MRWPSLLEEAGIRRVELLVLDVEGAELEVVKGMRGNPVLPEIFCIEHGHLGVEAVREAVEPLSYRYDGGAEVNSFFVRLPPVRRWLNQFS